MSELGELKMKLEAVAWEDVYPDVVINEILNEAKAEIPTRADAEKAAKERIGRELRHDGFDVALIACIHAELYGAWASKWFGNRV